MSSALPALLAAGLLATTVGLRLTVVDDHYRQRQERRLDEDMLTSPGPVVLNLVSAEHALMGADLTWLGIVQEIGRSTTLADATWDRVERWSHIATDLDQRYFTIYHSVGIVLTVFGHRVNASDKILMKGWDVLKTRWEFPLLLGYNAYFVHGDAALGSNYVSEAARLPDAPFFLAPLAGRMRFHSGDELGAIELLEYMIPYLDDRPREEAEGRLRLLKGEQRLRQFDEACRAFQARTATVPPSGQALVDAGMIALPPTDFSGNPIRFDANCIARTTELTVREFEAKARVGAFGRGESGGVEAIPHETP